jgi:hypothetical protein
MFWLSSEFVCILASFFWKIYSSFELIESLIFILV